MSDERRGDLTWLVMSSLKPGIAEVDLAIASDGDNDGVIFVGIFHVMWIVDIGQVNRNPFCNRGVTTMR